MERNFELVKPLDEIFFKFFDRALNDGRNDGTDCAAEVNHAYQNSHPSNALASEAGG